MKRFLFDTWYGALGVWCASLVLVLAAMAAGTRLLAIVGIFTLLTVPVAGLLLFAAWIVSLVRRRWLRALAQLLLGVGCFVGFMLVSTVMLIVSIFGPSEDHFADNLAIPPEIEADIIEPEDAVGSPFASAEAYEDDFAVALFAALAQPGGDDPTVACDLSALAARVHSQRAELMAYLARHPAWWLHEDGGRLCATRRWKDKGVWNHPLHGYYSGNTIPYGGQGDYEAYQKATHFQVRTTIGLPVSPFGRGGRAGAEHPAVATVQASLAQGNLRTHASCERFGDEAFCVEVFEESAARERRATKAALAFLTEEFATLSLPPDAAIRGPEAFVLRNAFQPGIYNLTLRINPGEPGVTYLKAFEATKGTRLSQTRLEDASNERVGWSDDPEEKFLYENQFTIYEGDWGKPYAARIEVWFRPDSGQPERKLLERTCKIEGWQR